MITHLGQIPPEVCDVAFKEFTAEAGIDATMTADGTQRNHDQRNTTIRFIDEWHWLSGIMFQHGQQANRFMKWDFKIDCWERIQFAEYLKDQHYDWHIDTFLLSGRPIDRKVSVVCLLNDPEEFEGGELQFELDGEVIVPELKKGSVIAFPSFLLHRVTPVTQGKRYSATMWLNGPAFK
jgi:PKHD-type hydroxylase